MMEYSFCYTDSAVNGVIYHIMRRNAAGEFSVEMPVRHPEGKTIFLARCCHLQPVLPELAHCPLGLSSLGWATCWSLTASLLERRGAGVTAEKESPQRTQI